MGASGSLVNIPRASSESGSSTFGPSRSRIRARMKLEATWLTTTARVAGLFLYGRHRKGRAKSSALAGRATKGGCSTMMLMEPPPSSRRAWCIRAFTVSWNQQRSTPTGRGAVGVHRDFRRGRSGHDQPRDFKGFPRTMSTGVCERHTCGESWGRVGAGRKSEHGEWTLPFHPRAASPT